MTWKTGMVLTALLAATSAFAIAQQEKPLPAGAAHITLKGGYIGDVVFPHHLHQKNVGDCKACHQLYPQQEGAIGKLKGEGALKSQQVMNSQCLNCHRENQKAGKTAGPTQCNKCHRRS